jgi:hypothetical protein
VHQSVETVENILDSLLILTESLLNCSGWRNIKELVDGSFQNGRQRVSINSFLLLESHGFLAIFSGGGSDTLDQEEETHFENAFLILTLLSFEILVTEGADELVVGEMDLGNTELHQVHTNNDANVSIVMAQPCVSFGLDLKLLSFLILENFTIVLFGDSAELFENLDFLFGAESRWEGSVFDVFTLFA